MKGIATPVKVSSLRANEFGGRNQAASSICRNAYASKIDIEGYTPDVLPLPPIYFGSGMLDLRIDWPFPQIFNTDTGIYIGTRDSLYSVSYVVDRWEAVTLTPAITNPIEWPWTLANSSMFPVFASGSLLVYYDYTLSMWIAYNKEIGYKSGTNWNSAWEQPVATCAFKGQIFMVGATRNTGNPSESRIVRWSEIGAFNFLGMTANPRKNTAGEMYLPIDNQDIVMRALPLGDSVIIYSNFQVVEMQPVMAPVPGFSITQVKDIGINNPLAVGGHEKEHLLVSRTGSLYSHTWSKSGAERGTGMKYLGFEEYLLPLVTTADMGTQRNTLSIVYNPGADEFYLSNGEVSYLYKNGGLTETSYAITSMVDFSNTQITDQENFTSMGNVPSALFVKTADDGLYYESDTLDFNISAIKVLEGLDIVGDFGAQGVAEAMIKWRNDKRGQFRETLWKRVSPEGVCAPIVAGVDFRICIRVSPCTDVVINSLMVKWKITDKRFIRGRYDTSNAS